jgi:hypothetical protein
MVMETQKPEMFGFLGRESQRMRHDLQKAVQHNVLSNIHYHRVYL